MMRVLSQVTAISILVLAGVSNSAHSFVIQLDVFNITKNGSTLMNDDFSDTAGLGLAGPMTEPSNNGGNPPLGIYTVVGSSGQSEGTVAGNRTFDTSNAPITPSSINPSINIQNTFIELRTNTGDAFIANGLKKDDTFVVEARVSLGNLVNFGSSDRYGVRVRERAPRNDELELAVRQTGGNIAVSFRRSPGVWEDIVLTGAELLAHDQIILRLLKVDAGFSTITAQFELLNGGASSGIRDLATSHDIFDGEEYTRASFRAIDIRVPEPTTLAIFGLGLAGLGLMRRRRRSA